MVPPQPAGPIVTAPAARVAAVTRIPRIAPIPDNDEIVGAPDITIVAHTTLRFVRRVQPHDRGS